MDYFVNCNTATLAPYTTPLDKLRAAHLYRRLGFSAPVQTIDQAMGQSAEALVDSLINEALSLPPLPPPSGQTGMAAIILKMMTRPARSSMRSGTNGSWPIPII